MFSYLILLTALLSFLSLFGCFERQIGTAVLMYSRRFRRWRRQLEARAVHRWATREGWL